MMNGITRIWKVTAIPDSRSSVTKAAVDSGFDSDEKEVFFLNEPSSQKIQDTFKGVPKSRIQVTSSILDVNIYA